MSALLEPICRREFDAAALMREFPPRFSHANKQVVYGISCPPGAEHAGRITFSRWAATNPPAVIPADATVVEPRADYFGYEPAPAGRVEWYLNFSHSDLFCAYGGSLFAQDEMQVTEHPALGALREALLKSDLEPLTVQHQRPTPVLVAGVERRCRVAINPDASQGRPNGLYGNNFGRAKPDVVAKATAALVPPTVTNVLAMEAPTGGVGRYARREIDSILLTAYTGFAAAGAESRQLSAAPPEVVVHTGYWGCGAYGGHRVLMAVLQVLAARLAGLNRLVFHTGDAGGAATFGKALAVLATDLGVGAAPCPLEPVLGRLDALAFQWGVSDGN
ncbi:hypothetical protein R5W23_001835 [Gemmata sp. JC673]|uniref:PARG catalytic Macro domain-containing protein n=1 Tax=Gemmata algarum TaxID=2975278 RepID=A0ABU5EZ63_9BACT|nr:hypothetical protein [Gemmata algarum]MDY3560590.1 hypothetical protein [Gemmata algarum]